MNHREYADGRYREALARFTISGNRYNALTDKDVDLVYWGAAAGYSVEDIIEDAHAAGATGEHDRSADIRALYAKKKQRVDDWNARHEDEAAHGRRTFAAPLRRVRPADVPAVIVGRVRRLIDEGRDIDDMEKLRCLSSSSVCLEADTSHASADQELRLLFEDEERVFVRSSKASAEKARLGVNLRPLGDWLGSANLDGGECVGINPHTGEWGETAGGSPSLYCTATVAAFRHMLMEFDHMSLVDQCRFWAGAIQRKALPLVCLVYSGNKSIHGVIRVDAKTAEKYRDLAADIAARYAVDANPDADPGADFSTHPKKHPEYYRLDVQALRNPLVCVRLAGVVRKDTGKEQTLLYAAPRHLNGERQRQTEPKTEAAPAPSSSATPAPAGAPFARLCAECGVISDCKVAFGGFWNVRSSGGIGCYHPFGGWPTGWREDIAKRTGKRGTKREQIGEWQVELSLPPTR